MTATERQIWISTFSAAYVAAARDAVQDRIDIVIEDVAAGAASVASEALAALKDARCNPGNGRLSLAATRDMDSVFGVEEP